MKSAQITKLLAVVFLLTGLTAWAQQPPIQYFRYPDQRGVNVFETPRTWDEGFEGLKVRIGGAFTQQMQLLSHENGLAGGDTTLYALAPGFNLATANLNIDVQLEDGVRLQLVTYLSSRHHPEAWVKGGFIQIDKLTFLSDNLRWFDDYFTLRVGHYQVNYGDMQFRRTDNGNAMYNPFVGNAIMDAFATEIGGDVTFQSPSGILAVVGMTTGEIQGNVSENDLRGPAFQLKLGWDSQVNDDLRLRFTGSAYICPSSTRNTLYGGDRAGSRFYYVMSDPGASASSDFTTGRVNPGLSNELTAFQITPFVKFKGLEFFAFYEVASGQNTGETESRSYTQILAELLYRLGEREQFYIGGRFNTVTGPGFSGSNRDAIVAADEDVTVNRLEAGAGWFVTKNILVKLTYVNQSYNDVVDTSKYFEGTFNGVMAEAVVAF
ncbi:hypothetical protein HZ996_03040 [Cryomorphaceae bacterium]|nr:hypothetical protein HZ996_03040 [Cryomorphaceae bacterium]